MISQIDQDDRTDRQRHQPLAHEGKALLTGAAVDVQLLPFGEVNDAVVSADRGGLFG